MEIIKTEKLQFLGKINYDDISIEENSAVFISGDSGSGKSSLLKLFNQTEIKTNGKIFYKGKDIDDINTVELRKEILLASQSVFLFEETIEENFKTYYEYRNEKCISKEEIQKYLNLCCIDFKLDTPCVNLSGGEKQRVYMAICLSFNPKVLMLDEPTSALDKQTADNFIKSIKKYASEKQITLIIITHEKEIIKKYADKIIYIGGSNNE